MPKIHKIALIEIHQETNSFSNINTQLADFQNFVLYYNEDIFEKAVEKYPKFQAAGFFKAVEKFGNNQIEIIPIVAAWANSGGPLEASVFEHFKQIVGSKLVEHSDLSGILLSMHGAMAVVGITDAEGAMIEYIRSLVGEKVIIGMPLDLHANITHKMVKYATFITGYHTNPHRDHYQVGFKATKILIDTVLGKIEPVMAVRKMKLLKGGGLGIDFLSPMRQIFSKMKRMEAEKGVLAVSNFMVHIWLDDPVLGWTTVAITDGNHALAEQKAEELAELNWAVRNKKHPQPDTPESAIIKIREAWLRRKMGTIVVCDLSDAVAAGAPGENTHIIRTLATQMADLQTFSSIRDAGVANIAYDLPEGTEIAVTLGGKLESNYNLPFDFKGIILKKHYTDYSGKIVILKNQGTHIVVSENANPVFYPKFYTDLGLNIWKADVVVVKNLFPFRYFFLKYNRLTINVLTPGTTLIDVFQLGYKHVPYPIYPLQEILDWK